jgi:hypothetical protein
MVTQNEYMEIINNGPPLNRDYRHGYGIYFIVALEYCSFSASITQYLTQQAR